MAWERDLCLCMEDIARIEYVVTSSSLLDSHCE